MTDLQDRLRGLPLGTPEGLGDRALRAAAEEPEPRRASHWLETAGAMVVVALLVILAVSVTAHPDARIFSNISAGLGS